MENQTENIQTPAPEASVQQIPLDPHKLPLIPMLLSLFVIILLIVSGYLFYQNMQLKNMLANYQSTPTPVLTISPTPTLLADPTADWKTYTDDILKFSFKHPSKFSIEIQPKDDGRGISYLFAPNYISILNVLTKYSIDDTKYFMNTTSSGNVIIGDYSWKTYFLPKGSPEGTVGTGEPIFILQTEINKKLVTFISYNQTNITEEQSQILSTFKFIDTSTSSYQCPASGWVGCMPILSEEGKRACSTEAMAWYKANCPNFKGAAL